MTLQSANNFVLILNSMQVYEKDTLFISKIYTEIYPMRTCTISLSQIVLNHLAYYFQDN